MRKETKLSQSVSVFQSDVPTEKLLALLDNTLWGTPGHTMYKHLQTRLRAFDIKAPFFFILERASSILCAVCLAWRSVCLQEKAIDSYYVRYFVANASINRDGLRNKNAPKQKPKGFIKQFMEDIFSAGATIKDPLAKDRPSLFYAYVERENEQSMHLCNYFGFRSIRKLATLPFSRFNPRRNPSVRKMKAEERESVFLLVRRQYASHGLAVFEHLFFNGNYYVVELDGEIVAGAQANPVSWAIKELGGVTGKVLVKLLPYIPYLNRLINPGLFNYSALEGVFVQDGYEWVLDQLFESIIADQGHTVALMWFDTECPVFSLVKEHCSLGLMNKLNSGTDADVVVRGEMLCDDDWVELENTPVYISCFDLT